MPELKRVYQGSYRSTLEDPDNSVEDAHKDAEGNPSQTSDTQETSWRKRYSDLRSYNTSLTERVKELENQLTAAQRKEIKIPSSVDELNAFAGKYPDVVRHIRSIAMQELLQERENISQETKVVKENLEKMEKELGKKKILAAHPDFEELNTSDEFHLWASSQPKQIQEWVYESSNPELCIKALDLFKVEVGFKKTVQNKKRETGADVQVRTRTPVEMPSETDKRIWKESEILKLHPKAYEKHEAEIEQARREGRIDPYS